MKTKQERTAAATRPKDGQQRVNGARFESFLMRYFAVPAYERDEIVQHLTAARPETGARNG